MMMSGSLKDLNKGVMMRKANTTANPRPMPNSPDLTFNALGRYEWPMANGSMAAQLDMQYVDDRSLNGIDHPSLQATDYIVANASLSWASSDEHWDLRVYVKNFTDEAYIPTLFDLAGIQGTNIEQVAAPRWFGGSVRYNFF